MLVTELVGDDEVILDMSLQALVMALEALYNETRPLGLQVSQAKTKVEVFRGLLVETVQNVCGEDIEIFENSGQSQVRLYNKADRLGPRYCGVV